MTKLRNRFQSIRSFFDDHFSIEQSVSSRHLLVHWAACAVEVVLVIAFVPLVFETNDDVVMNSLVAGATTAEPNQYMMFTNIVIGKLLVSLYHWSPAVNWYTWYLILSLGIGYATIQYCFVVLKGSAGVRVIRHILLLGLFIHVFFILQFTRVASVVIAAGLLLILLSENRQFYRFMAGVFLIVLGSAIRYPVFIMYAIIGFPVILGLLLRWRVGKLAWIAAAFVGCFVLNLYHTNVYDSNHEMLEYKEFNSIRSSITTTDSPQFTYESHGAFAEKLGWSKNDFMLASNFNLDVGYPKFSEENLDKLIEHKNFEISDISSSPLVLVVLKKVGQRWIQFLIQWQHIPLLMVVTLLSLNRAGRRWFLTVFYFIFVLAVSFALALLANGQLKPWVLYGMTLPVFLLLIYFVSTLKEVPTISLHFLSKKAQSNGVLVITIAVVALPVARLLSVLPEAVNLRIARDAAVHKAIQEFDDPFYVGWTSLNHYDLFELPYDKSRAYALGWRAGSPWNKNLIEEYTGQSNIGVYSIKDLPVTWYFRTADDINFQNYRNLVEQFYLENYPESTVDYQKYIVNERDTLHRYTFLINS